MDLIPVSLIPPGLPIRYTRLCSRVVCGHCGGVSEQTRLWATFRTATQSSNGALVPGSMQRPLGASEVMYTGIAVETQTTHAGTPACDRCIDTAPKNTFTPLPPPRHALKPDWAVKAGREANNPKRPTTLEDIML